MSQISLSKRQVILARPLLLHYISYYLTKLLSNFSLCPFNSFCFSYKLFRSSLSFCIRFNFSLTPSRHSSSICLYSPVRLRILLLFSFICSETHIQSTKSRTSISVSYRSVCVRIYVHSRTITFFSVSVILSLNFHI